VAVSKWFCAGDDFSLLGLGAGAPSWMIREEFVRVKNSKEMANILAALRWMTSVMDWPDGWAALR
jgi:hypothetical protein